MLVTCGYPDPQYLKISTVATSQTCINLCSLHHSNTTTLGTYHQREKCKKPHQENITMATSGIQQSAFAGQTALKQSNEFVRKFGGSGNSRFVMRRTVKSAPQSICFCNITDKLQSKSNIALPPPPLEALSRRRLSVDIGASFCYGLSPFMAKAEENSADKEENDKGVIGAIESLFDPNEKTKSGKVLPKAYLNSARELVKTLRESVNESPDDIAKFRRTADAAKESIREYLGIWRGQQTVVQEESYDVLVKAIRSLADFYSKAGPSAPLPEEVKSQILDYLNTAEEFL